MQGHAQQQQEREEQETTEQPCPSCNATIPVVYGYVTWCEHCGWNLQPQEPLVKKSRFGLLFDSMYEKIGERSSRKLYEQVTKKASVKPTFKPTVMLALLIAYAVHALTVETPRYVMSAVDQELLEKELAPLYEELEVRLLEWYQEYLY